MWQRILGVFKLNVETFEEIEHDEAATTQAAIVVGIVALLGAIGAFGKALVANSALSAVQDTLAQLGNDVQLPFELAGLPTLSPLSAAISAFIGAFVVWLIWSALTYFIGNSLFDGDATMGQMLRVLGFAQAPRLLSVFGFIPCIGTLLGLAGAIWSLVASFIAIRQGLDIDNGKTALTVIISFIVVFGVNTVLSLLFVGLS